MASENDRMVILFPFTKLVKPIIIHALKEAPEVLLALDARDYNRIAAKNFKKFKV